MSNFRGFKACTCLLEWLPVYEQELRERGLIKRSIDIYQLIGGARASAGTHSSGGAFDLAQFSIEQIRVARKMGADATWHRTRAQGFTPHAHGVLRGCPHNAPARYQITSREFGVDYGRNGLANRGADDGPKPLSKRSYKQGISWAKANQKKRAKANARPTWAVARPKVEPRHWGRVISHNIGWMNATGRKAAGPRRAAALWADYIELTPDVVAVQELPNDLVPVFTRAANDVGYYRAAGGNGRHIYKRAGLKSRSGGWGQLQPTLDGDSKEYAFTIVTIGGAEMPILNLHLEHTAGEDQLRVDQAAFGLSVGRKLTKAAGLPEARLVVVGDMNSEDWVTQRAFNAAGWVSAAETAYRVQNVGIKTLIGWDGDVIQHGDAIDHAYTHRGRPARYFGIRRRNGGLSDHLLIVIDVALKG